MRRTVPALAMALCLALGLALPVGAYADVPADAWYAPAVEEVSAQGLMNGTGGDQFSPGGQVTRGMVVAVLWRLAGEPEAEAPGGFADVEDWYYYAGAVAWAQAAGVAAGLGDGTFGGGQIVTREQLAVFLCRYAQVTGEQVATGTLEHHPDADQISSWAQEGMAHAVGAGLITGRDDGALDPAGAATRAELAVILQRLMIPAVG